ncbi:MAG: hypothetical protein R3E01_32855 [Pirellulaceae bacterium]|nr:hypothetical protein [Planctomycetales bacterium]
MTFVSTFLAATLAFVLLSVAGCSSAAHCYSGCHINCHYFPPAPLPLTPYPACVCHSAAAGPWVDRDLSMEAVLASAPCCADGVSPASAP